MASVVLKHLDKQYPNGVHAVRDLNLEVADGEFVVLVGPSGCGKTTTLRLIAGLEEPTSGEIHIGERIVNRISPAKRDVGMVFQNCALYPHMSVFRNLAFGLKMRGVPRAEIQKRVRQTAEMLAIESLLERRPSELSGGERQRVALGRTIVREPKVFLFDEPLSDLDAQLRVQMRTEIAQLHRRLSATILYVTHDQAEAMTLGERIVLMDHGAAQQVDTPMNIYKRPANRLVASFIGSRSMNFFSGEVRSGEFRFNVRKNGAGVAAVPIGELIPDGPAVLGVRPEDLLCGSDGTSLGDVSVIVVEQLGHEAFAHFTFAGGDHIVRLSTTAAVRPGDRLPLAIRQGAVHLFSLEDGRRLT